MASWTGVNTDWSKMPMMYPIPKSTGYFVDENGRFWFRDEVGVDLKGPYNDYDEVVKEAKKYYKSL